MRTVFSTSLERLYGFVQLISKCGLEPRTKASETESLTTNHWDVITQVYVCGDKLNI